MFGMLDVFTFVRKADLFPPTICIFVPKQVSKTTWASHRFKALLFCCYTTYIYTYIYIHSAGYVTIAKQNQMYSNYR